MMFRYKADSELTFTDSEGGRPLELGKVNLIIRFTSVKPLVYIEMLLMIIKQHYSQYKLGGGLNLL